MIGEVAGVAFWVRHGYGTGCSRLVSLDGWSQEGVFRTVVVQDYNRGRRGSVRVVMHVFC